MCMLQEGTAQTGGSVDETKNDASDVLLPIVLGSSVLGLAPQVEGSVKDIKRSTVVGELYRT